MTNSLKICIVFFSEEVLRDKTEPDKLCPSGTYQISCGLLVLTSRHLRRLLQIIILAVYVLIKLSIDLTKERGACSDGRVV